ncbi:MAG: alpha/beta fold hydrolase [Anaerolineae bacterium]
MNRPNKRGCLYWIRLLTIGIGGGLLFACVAIEVLYVETVVRPANGLVVGNPASRGVPYESVTLTGADGVRLAAWYIPSKNRAAVILLHGYGNNRAEMLDRAIALARHGYGLVLYDERGSGESAATVRAMGWPDVVDVRVALDWLAQRNEVDPARIGILGFSVGGQIALRAAAQDARLKGVIADDPGFVSVDDAPALNSAYEYLLYGVNWVDGKGVAWRSGVPQPEGMVKQIPRIAPRPVLFIASGGPDQPGNRLVRYFYQLASAPKNLWEIPETYHGGTFAARPLEYEERMTSFFDQALLQ